MNSWRTSQSHLAMFLRVFWCQLEVAPKDKGCLLLILSSCRVDIAQGKSVFGKKHLFWWLLKFCAFSIAITLRSVSAPLCALNMIPANLKNDLAIVAAQPVQQQEPLYTSYLDGHANQCERSSTVLKEHAPASAPSLKA